MKKILLDSHALFWFIDGDSRLSDAARSAIEAIDCGVCVSAATAWEIVNKVRIGKWPGARALANDLAGIISNLGFEHCRSALSTRAMPVWCGARTAIRSTACSPHRPNSQTCPW